MRSHHESWVLDVVTPDDLEHGLDLLTSLPQRPRRILLSQQPPDRVSRVFVAGGAVLGSATYATMGDLLRSSPMETEAPVARRIEALAVAAVAAIPGLEQAAVEISHPRAPDEPARIIGLDPLATFSSLGSGAGPVCGALLDQLVGQSTLPDPGPGMIPFEATLREVLDADAIARHAVATDLDPSLHPHHSPMGGGVSMVGVMRGTPEALARWACGVVADGEACSAQIVPQPG